MYPSFAVDPVMRMRPRTALDDYARWEYGAGDATFLLAEARRTRGRSPRRALAPRFVARLRAFLTASRPAS